MSEFKKLETTKQSIALNRKARHDYSIEQCFEAGLVLEGWEVKSLRAGKGQLKDSYVILRQGAAWLINCHISPLSTASTHIHPEPERTRKLLLHPSELNKLYGGVERKGNTIIPLELYWKKNKVKCEIALVKGKKQYDKRETLKERDWNRQKERLMKKF